MKAPLPAAITANPLLNALVHPRMSLLRHLLLLGLLLVLFRSGEQQYSAGADLFIGAAVFVFFIGQIYINMYLLVPRFLFRNKYGLYFGAAALLVTISYFSLLLADHFFFSRHRITPPAGAGRNVWDGLFAYAFLLGIIISASTAVKLFQKWVVDACLMHEMEKGQLRSELEQLKNQINPHFLFNMLNNANVLTHKDPQKASAVLVKLSDLLRYQIYDSARDKVLLTADIRFLADLLDLEKTRRDQFDYFISREGQISSIMISPFLFVTFVENAIKHSMDARHSAYINLYFTVTGNTLTFRCENSLPVENTAGKRPGGVGMANVKRRLELLYPGTHQLHVHHTADIYAVTLTLPI